LSFRFSLVVFSESTALAIKSYCSRFIKILLSETFIINVGYLSDKPNILLIMQILSGSSKHSPVTPLSRTTSWTNILLSAFLLWTLILGIATLQVQHSCSPMLHWPSTPLPEYCSQQTIPKESDGVAETIGISAGVVVAILEAPLIVAVGAGALAWFLFKKTFG
jgi:hypothetical protein